MSAEIVYAGLAERFATIAGIKRVLLGEPSAAHDLPLIYSGLAGFTREQAGQVTGMRYRFQHRLVIRYQDSAAAERELLALIDAVPLAISADRQLGGRIASGLATITEAITGIAVIGGVSYRIADYTSETLVKRITEGV